MARWSFHRLRNLLVLLVLLAVTPALVLMHGWDMTILKLAGTDRSIEWSIRQVT